jgi:transposase-like protein
MIRNSTKYVLYRELKAVMADLKEVYGAVSEEAALYALEEFKDKWELNKIRTASATALIRISRTLCGAQVGLHRSPILHMKKSISSITK